MDSFKREHLAANPFRVLGLPSDADQSAVDEAARKLRIWPDPARIPPTPWDLPWVGPLVRSRTAIEQALARLDEPRSRIQARLFWPQFPEPAVNAEATPAAAHDDLIHALYRCIRDDANVDDVDAWQKLLGRSNNSEQEIAYAEWLGRIERDGDFDKPANADDIREAIRVLPRVVTDLLSERAIDGLFAGDLPTFGGVVRLLQGKSFYDHAAKAAALALDEIEDQMTRRADVMNQRLAAVTQGDPSNLPSNLNAAVDELASAIGTWVMPMLKTVEGLSAGQPARLQRVRHSAACMLRNLAIAWARCGEHAKVEVSLQMALEYVPDTPLAAKLRDMIEQNRQAMGRKTGRGDAGGHGAWSRREVAVQPAPVRPSSASSKSSGRRGRAASPTPPSGQSRVYALPSNHRGVTVGLILLLSMLVRFISSQSSQPPTSNVPSMQSQFLSQVETARRLQQESQFSNPPAPITGTLPSDPISLGPPIPKAGDGSNGTNGTVAKDPAPTFSRPKSDDLSLRVTFPSTGAPYSNGPIGGAPAVRPGR